MAFIALLGRAAYAQTFSVIHAFTGTGAGAIPDSGVTIRAGVLYGTTKGSCGSTDCGYGSVYQIAPLGPNWHFTPISLLAAGGSGPLARVVFGPDRHLYGTASQGGNVNGTCYPYGCGVVFSVTPNPTICATANCFWTENVLHQFAGSPDGEYPISGDLVWDSMGNIYGTTAGGGSSNAGTVYEITKSGNKWTETPIYSFTGADGADPSGGVILDNDGNLFGTTLNGGLDEFGTVFELTYVNGIGWTETVLYKFQNQSDGYGPYAGLIKDSAGNLYGATSYGGSGGGGTVFELSPVGDSWVFTTLYSFSGYLGCGPAAALTMDHAGALYGTTHCDGTNHLGNVFKLTNTQNGWGYSSLHDFTGGADGDYPESNVTFDTDGNLYGTAGTGGNSSCNPPYGCGTVWMIKP